VAYWLLLMLPEDERPAVVAGVHRLGETWLGERLVTWTDDDVVAPGEAAAMVAVTPDILRNWVRLGELRRTGSGYRARDVLDAAAAVRRRRAVRKNAGQSVIDTPKIALEQSARRVR